MRTICIFLFVISVMLSSCVKENTPTIPGTQTVDTTMALTRYVGTFMNGPYGSVQGTAKIYLLNGQFLLALENVNISNGPDLHVYLSKEVIPVNFIDLGRLQSVAGNQLYSIMGSPDFSQYRYALIHCQRYNHLFGSAELQ
jgi:hypothetical protein